MVISEKWDILTSQLKDTMMGANGFGEPRAVIELDATTRCRSGGVVHETRWWCLECVSRRTKILQGLPKPKGTRDQVVAATIFV